MGGVKFTLNFFQWPTTMPMSSTHSEVYEKESEFREEHEAFWNTKADDFITPKSAIKAFGRTTTRFYVLSPYSLP